ncbi:hypothetical protein FKK32_29000, partial [Klebsiella pneumoniae]|nr:hypothetical protein [Klebsiella pneumoniae]
MGGIAQRHHRQHVRAAQQHHVVGGSRLHQRIHRLFEHARIGRPLHRCKPDGFHRRRHVDGQQLGLQAATLVGGHQLFQRGLDAGQSFAPVLAAQCAAMHDDDLVHDVLPCWKSDCGQDAGAPQSCAGASLVATLHRLSSPWDAFGRLGHNGRTIQRIASRSSHQQLQAAFFMPAFVEVLGVEPLPPES